jgi:hypothetical protein
MKILRKICGLTQENGIRRIRTNQELNDLCREPDVFSEIRIEKLRCLRHVVIMPEERTVKKAFKIIPEEKGSLESQEGNGRTMLKITRIQRVLEVGEKITRDRDTWKLIVKEARVLQELWGQWR